MPATIEIEDDAYEGGLIVRWPSLELFLLIDGLEREAWLVWHGKPLGRAAFGQA